MTIAGIVVPVSAGFLLGGPWPSMFGVDLRYSLLAFGFVLGAVGFALYVVGQPRPCVTLNGSDAFHVERVMMQFPESRIRTPFPADALFMRVINRSRRPSGRSAKARVSAHFRVYGHGTAHLPSLDARWSDTPQPRPGELGERSVDLEVDAGRQIVLVLKEPDRTGCYLFNNDSYNFGQEKGQRPEWRLPPGRYRAQVRVSGESVSKRFGCEFENPGAGEALKVVRSWEE